MSEDASTSRSRGASHPADGELSLLLRALAAAPAGEEATTWRRPLAPGDRIGRFAIGRQLGRGGFGVVHEALDLTLRRSVAFKVVRPGPEAAAALREAHILREAEAAARLAHPNIVTVHEVGLSEQGPYLVLELLRGRPLAARLAEGPLPPLEALDVAREVARALAHAHREGVVHRDLSPGNVFLCDDGRVKVLDFGLAHAFGHRGCAGGTPSCMAPEQRRQEPEDERTDVFALGVLLHWSLAGQPPFGAGGAEGVGPTLIGPEPAAPLLVPEVTGLGPLVSRLLEKAPGGRPRDGAEASAALEVVAAGLGARQAAPSPEVAPRQRLWRAGATVAALALGAAVALLLRPQPAVTAPRLLVAVADATNATGDPQLDAIGALVATSLEQSRRLSILSPARLGALARRDGGPPGRVDALLAARLGRGLGAGLVLEPVIRRATGGYELELVAAGPGGGTVIGRASGVAATALVDQVAGAVRRATGEPDAELTAASVTTEVAVTSNLKAYQHYLEGQRRASEEFDATGALAAYRQALAADPAFALPHLAISFLCTWHEVPGEDGLARVDAALAGRLPAKERRLAEALRLMLRREFLVARPLLVDLAADYDRDPDVLYLAGEAHWHGGAPTGPATAVELFRQVLAAEPATLEASIHLFQWLAKAGRGDEAIAVGRRAAKAHPGPMSEAMLARGLAIAGDLPRAIETARRGVAVGGGHFEASYALAELQAHQGDWAAAERELGRWIEADASGDHARIALEFMPILLAAQGKAAAAQRSWRALRELRCGQDCEYFDALLAVHLGLAAGDEAAALAALRRWPGPTDVAADPHAWLWTWLGEPATGAARAARLERGSLGERRHAAAVLLKAGRSAEAAGLLRPLATQDAGLETTWLLGLALERSGLDAEAAEAFARLDRTYPMYGPFWQASLRPAALLHLAGCLSRLGQAGPARTVLERLLAQLQGADPGHPLAARAAALALALGSGSAAPPPRAAPPGDAVSGAPAPWPRR